MIEISIEEYAEEVGVIGLLVDKTLKKMNSYIVEFVAAGKTDDCVVKNEVFIKEKAEEVNIMGTLIDKALEKVDSYVIKFIVAEEIDDYVTKEERKRLKIEDIDRTTVIKFQVEKGTIDN